MKCIYCNKACCKAGKNNTGKQKYYCSSCNKYQQNTYSYKAYDLKINEQIINYVKNGCGIRSIGRLIHISNTTVMKRIRSIAASLESTYSSNKRDSYEMDELKTYTGYKENNQWLIYAINRSTRRVVDILIGKRDKIHIKKIVDKVLHFHPKTIYTDRLNLYPGLIDKDIHRPGRYLTNRIERMNLTFRTHLKRLTRNTLCYSKKADMLEACVKIYLWA